MFSHGVSNLTNEKIQKEENSQIYNMKNLKQILRRNTHCENN